MTSKVAQMPRVSYSQNGEDILLDRVFGDHVGTFVDLGACHPRWDSNTYFFHQRGWRGINVEPNPRLHALFQLERPEDRNLSLAVSDCNGELTFYDVVDNIGLSTLATDVAMEHRRQGFQVEERPVQVRTVASLIEEFQIAEPDFLSLDVEAHEGEVLAGTPLESWRPKVLVIESTLPRTSIACHQEWEHRIIELGYIFAAFNGVNRFYLRDDLREKLDCFRNPVNAVDDFQRSELVEMRRELEAVASALDRSHAERDAERRQADELRVAWDFARHQAHQAEQQWQQECESFHRQRLAFEEAHRSFDNQRNDWIAARGVWEQERQDFERARSQLEQVHELARELTEQNTLQAGEIHRFHQEIAVLRTQLEVERAAWRTEHAGLVAQIESSQRNLRPYVLIDRLGVVPSSYGFARRLKHKMATEVGH